MTILFIVESPGKIAKISKFLGNGYEVKASVGIFRDLDPNSMSIDFENGFEPIYIFTKPDVVKNLKGAMHGVDMVYVATDLDREGEGIAQSILDVLKPKKYKRLRYNAITKDAILEAIKNAGKIDENLVKGQKARRVIDRLFGYLISPLLRKKYGGKLSAGRVQSVAERIIIDRENEIEKFMKSKADSTFFKVHGCFAGMKSSLHELNEKKKKNTSEYTGATAKIPLVDDSDTPNAKVVVFLKRCLKSTFTVHSVADKMSYRSPAPPFTTSTLQQEANRKLGMSLDATMSNAQKLYEAGFITYMRTDSVEISAEGHTEIKKIIEQEYGAEYYQKNVYKNKSSTSQEAHEAIRPVHPDLISLEDEINDTYQIKLYKLIWQRTIASQMKQAQINVTTIQIDISKYLEEEYEPFYYFQSQVEKVVFPGFMSVYVESVDDPEEETTTKNFKGKIPKQGDVVAMDEIVAKQEYLKPPPRYTQASLVKKLENLEIGRPSTYVNTVKTILDRKYVEVGDVKGVKKDTTTYKIKSEDSKGKSKKHIMEIFEEEGHVMLGQDKKKLIPTKLGITVNDFLLEHFSELIDYKFTAKMEENLDLIAQGEKDWKKVVKKFYEKLEPIVEELDKQKSVAKESERVIGEDEDGNQIVALKTKNGPAVMKKVGKKAFFANIPEDLTIETITLKQALKLFEYPKVLGKHEKKELILNKGPYGFYLIYGAQKIPVKDLKPEDIDLEKAIELLEAKKANQLGEFKLTENGKKVTAVVLQGQYGPYIQVTRGKKKDNYPVPKDIDPSTLDDEKVLELISKKKTKSFVKKKETGGSKRGGKAVAPKKTTTKKVTIKKKK